MKYEDWIIPVLHFSEFVLRDDRRILGCNPTDLYFIHYSMAEPDLVKNLMPGIITTTSISLSWEKPDGNTSFYEIQILGDPIFNKIVTLTSDTIEGLTPGNYYTLLVTAVVGENNVTGNSSELSVYTKPELVTNLMVGIITTTSISLSWEKPDGNASSYEIQILGDPTFNKTVTITSDTIEGLTPGNYYTLLVNAVVGENNVIGNSSAISVYTKPDVVKNLMTSIITTTSISLSWEKPDGNASSYYIQILGDPTFNKTVTSTSDIIDGLTPGNYYTLLVTAVIGENNVTGNSSAISVYTKPDLVKKPMTGIITTTSISLSWEKPDGNASSYDIQILGDPTFNKTVTSTSDTIDGLTPGNYYTLIVTAVVEENNATGNSSAIFVYTKPDLVKNLMTGIITTTSISLNWQKPDGNASAYEIQILGDPTFNRTVTSTSDTIDGLTPGNYYTLLVTAVVGEDNMTGNSSEISVYTKPDVVKNLMHGIITTTSISLSWEKPDGNASSYEIQILGDPTSNKTVTSTSDTIGGLTPGNYYTLLVTAVIGENNVTGNSSEISVYTKPDVVKNLMPGVITTTSISLSWEKPDGNASSYEIQILGDPTFNKPITSTSDTIEGLTPGNYYALLVTAVVGENNVTGNSSEISVYTSEYFYETL
ncbi:receptor-type tyrosine-protein phosphatase eta-like [Anomaloglossus baeobatrachus]